MHPINQAKPMLFYIKMLFLVGVMVWLAGPAFGKYYQYTDANGVLRFTDDLANVPKGQRPNVKTYKSVKGKVREGEAGPGSTVKGASSSATTESGNPPSTNSWGEKIARQRKELDRRQAELNELFMKLQNDRTALAAKAPAAGASSKTINAYRQQVNALNARIARYEKQRAEFKKKVTAFNNKFNK
jgi:uncharacterized coiled-coil protein SlyX